MDVYDDVDALRAQNDELLFKFQEWLKAKGLAEKTINNHVNNIDFYVNQYLLYYDTIRPEDGWYKIDDFLGDWFIRKAMWSSVSSIKAYATGFKKFYTFLFEEGKITQGELETTLNDIKEGLPEWVEAMEKYMSPNFSFEDWLLMTSS